MSAPLVGSFLSDDDESSNEEDNIRVILDPEEYEEEVETEKPTKEELDDDNNYEPGRKKKRGPTSTRSKLAKAPILDRSRWVIGWGKQGILCKKIAIRDLEDPDMGRIYTNTSKKLSGYQTFTCKCSKSIVSTITDGERIVLSAEKPHSCESIPFRLLFFLLFKWTQAYGSREEIEAFHTSMYAECKEPGYINVLQRDWSYGESNEFEKNSVVFVREEENRHLARRYNIQKASTNTQELRYSCASCSEEKTELVVAIPPSRIPVVFKPAEIKHSRACRARNVAEVAAELRCNIPDYEDLDIYRIVPKDEYSLGFSSHGTENGRIIVRCHDNLEMCYHYGRMTVSTKKVDKTFYICTRCQTFYYVYYIHGIEPRVLAPNVPHRKCKPRLYEAELEQQAEFSGHLFSVSNKVIDESVPTLKVIPKGQVHVNDMKTEIFISAGENLKPVYKYLLTDESPKGVYAMKTFQCVSCTSVAYLRVFSGEKMTVKGDLKHVQACKPRLLKAWVSGTRQSGKQKEKTQSIDKWLKKRVKINLDVPTEASATRDAVEVIPDLESSLIRSILKRRHSAISNADDGELGRQRIDGQGKGFEGTRRKSVRFSLSNEESPPAVCTDFECSTDLISKEDEKADSNGNRNKSFCRPGDLWLADSCKVFGLAYFDAAYKAWSTVARVPLDSSKFPPAKSVKTFSSGFGLCSYLLTGAEDQRNLIKEHIGMFFEENKSTLGLVAGIDCAKIGREEWRRIVYPNEMTLFHFGLLSKMVKCTVVVYDYVKMTRVLFGLDESGETTVVVGLDTKGYFIFVE